jgi:apolipoprotein D and lipocalin family protein
MLFSCSTIPKGITAVTQFDKAKYLGKWYEIARFDFRFERDLNNTTAEYSANINGSIKVVNKGYNTRTNKWKSATIAMLKVSFFGPFYGGYNVIAIDKDYSYALIAGNNLNYMWILSRTTTIPAAVKSDYLQLAQKLGFKINDLIWVKHD